MSKITSSWTTKKVIGAIIGTAIASIFGTAWAIARFLGSNYVSDVLTRSQVSANTAEIQSIKEDYVLRSEFNSMADNISDIKKSVDKLSDNQIRFLEAAAAANK